MFLSREIGISYAHKTEDSHFWTLKLYDALDTFQQRVVNFFKDIFRKILCFYHVK